MLSELRLRFGVHCVWTKQWKVCVPFRSVLTVSGPEPHPWHGDDLHFRTFKVIGVEWPWKYSLEDEDFIKGHNEIIRGTFR